MIPKKRIDEILDGYGDDITITTVCSHTALQIFHGAKKEGFKTLGIATRDRINTYDAFPLAKPDEYIVVDKMSDILNENIQEQLRERHAVIVPHGSFVEYVGSKNIEDRLEVPMLGNRAVLDWESDREKERKWLKEAGCKVPPRIKDPSQIDMPCLVKFCGAKGGRGFFIALNEEEFYRKLGDRNEDYIIQEFILGTRYYHHFFYSPLSDIGYKAGEGHIELLGIDRRNESNIDELHRFGFTRDELERVGVKQTFVVTGNLPLVVRESLLPKIFEMGRSVVDKSVEWFYPGMVGPFCLETICTDDLEFYVFEISARIVAGTNLYPMGSHYSYYMYDEPMSTGRRIAIELKNAIKQNRVKEVVY